MSFLYHYLSTVSQQSIYQYQCQRQILLVPHNASDVKFVPFLCLSSRGHRRLLPAKLRFFFQKKRIIS